MIDGERGQEILLQIVAHRMDALVDGDVLATSLIGVCIADAIRKGDTPKQVAHALWEGLPRDDVWEAGLRDQIVEAIDEFEGRQAA